MSTRQAYNALFKGKIYLGGHYSQYYEVVCRKKGVYTLIDNSNPHKERLVCEYNINSKALVISTTAIKGEIETLQYNTATLNNF